MLLDPSPYPSINDRAYALVDAIADLFEVSDITLDYPEPGFIRLRGDLLCDLNAQFDTLRARFEHHAFTPLIRDESGDTVLIAIPKLFRPKRTRPFINLALFIATIFTTLWVGSAYETGAFGADSLPAFISQLWQGWPFSLSILVILGAHELGHYFAARYHKVNVTLPYFIPVPTILGTLGAFIAIREPIKNKRALFDIGASGPLAGLVFALPILAFGLATSELGPSNPQFAEGNSLLYAAMKVLVLGQFYPANGVDVYLNQVAWAGWCGLLVTGINLMPIGQLDGGHSAYVLFGKRSKLFFWPVIVGMIVISLVFRTTIWVLWTALLFFFGRMHAEPLDSVTDPGWPRRALALFLLILFVLTFVPVPLPTG